MSDGDDVPIEVELSEESRKSCNWSMSGNGLLKLFIWLVVLFIGAFFILWLIKPTFVLSPPTTDINWGKLSLSSFIFALLGIIIIWIVMSCSH